MNAHNLQLQIQSIAITVRVEGMKAENKIRSGLNQSPAYGQDDFEYYASELDALMQGVSYD